MLKKNLDEMMYLSGQQSAIDELENVQTEHEFSDRYQQKKKALLDSILSEEDSVTEEAEEGYTVKNEKKNNRRKRRWSRGVAAAVMFLVIGSLSITTYATAKYMLTDKESRGNVVTVGMSDGEGDELEVPWLSYEFGYVPEGYSEWQPRYFSKDGESGGKGFYVMQWQGSDTTFEYLEKRTETTINGKQAVCYEMSSLNYLMQNAIQVMYNDSGVMYELRSDDPDITMDELLKIAEGIKVTEGEMVAIHVEPDDARVEASDNPYIDVPADHILAVGQTENKLQWDKEDNVIDLTLNKMEVTDDLKGLDPQYFYNYEDDIEPFTDGSGVLLDFTGNKDVYDANGVHQEQENRKFKVIRASFTATNTSDTKQEFWAGGAQLCRLTAKENAFYGYENYQGTDMYTNYSPADADGNPVYFNQPQYTQKDVRNHYFFIDLAAGETVTYEVAFICYADDMDNLYMSFDGTGAGMMATQYEDGMFDAEASPVWFWKVQ